MASPRQRNRAEPRAPFVVPGDGEQGHARRDRLQLVDERGPDTWQGTGADGGRRRVSCTTGDNPLAMPHAPAKPRAYDRSPCISSNCAPPEATSRASASVVLRDGKLSKPRIDSSVADATLPPGSRLLPSSVL